MHLHLSHSLVYLFDDFEELSQRCTLIDILECFRNKVPPAELRKYEALQHTQAKQLWLLSRVLLLYGLYDNKGKLCIPEIAYNAHNKPYFKHCTEFHFNISYCSQAVACAFSNYAIGIDVHEVSEANVDLSQALSSAELRYVESAEHKEDALTRIWVCKEAFVKALGEGVTSSTNKYNLIDHGVIKQQSSGFHITEYHTIDSPYYLAVCARDQTYVRWVSAQDLAHFLEMLSQY
ncbi:4'-phosphopantetheinyl transferase [Bifidobacterium dolichotidis]|uniref:4'-phosphopantetheinyl transferase n=1 Tax=Bifidobacterium dolichotidis TaxID=2306976 RepID=A0A430FT25_9BIFI|nr:4'-phosphopantetheinyl transferase superfamily protein [Bifidobacterium dolichotidis]RSX56028.1 4'-phosphopantetheinyl transferase [Bifidobacterium dolichotidis]